MIRISINRFNHDDIFNAQNSVLLVFEMFHRHLTHSSQNSKAPSKLSYLPLSVRHHKCSRNCSIINFISLTWILIVNFKHKDHMLSTHAIHKEQAIYRNEKSMLMLDQRRHFFINSFRLAGRHKIINELLVNF